MDIIFYHSKNILCALAFSEGKQKEHFRLKTPETLFPMIV